MGKSLLKRLTEVAAHAVGDEDTVANVLGRVGVSADDARKIAGHVSSAARDFGISDAPARPSRGTQAAASPDADAETVADPPAAAEAPEPEPAPAAPRPVTAAPKRNRNMALRDISMDPIITANFPLAEPMQDEFVRILEASGLTAECENAATAMVAVIVNQAGKATVTENLCMYVDGGDSYGPACLFFRSGEGRSGKPGVHVPPAAVQQALIDASGCYSGRPDAETISHYLSDALNKQAGWADYAVGKTVVAVQGTPDAGLE